MTLLASILLLALTRAEIIERMKAPPIIRANGLVEVVADCPAQMRREFQMPVATFVSGVCQKLYTGLGEKPRRFEAPGLVVYLGEVVTNVPDVVTRRAVRDDGAKFTRLYLPAPAFTDVTRLRLETAKAFYRAVKGLDIDDATADRLLREADPRLRLDDLYAEIDRWAGGCDPGADDERCLKLARSVLEPGAARRSDVLRFASRLVLYPETYSSPFCGVYPSCTFREAIDLAARDTRIRFIAFARVPQLVAYGGGRGEELADAATAYAEFLRALAAYSKTPEELGKMLDDADLKLGKAMEAAAQYEESQKR